MNYAKPELLQHLSAEYVLGTLRGRARQRFERLLEQVPYARAEVDFWECRLAEFGQQLRPLAPPPRARDALLLRAAGGGQAPCPSIPVAPAGVALPAAGRQRRRAQRRQRRGLGAAAAAAALVAAFLLGRQHPQPAGEPESSPLPEVVALAPIDAVATDQPVETEAAPSEPAIIASGFHDQPEIYLAQLRLPASSMSWLLSLSRDHRRLSVVAADDHFTQGRQRFQLWWISPSRGPVPLAALPAERHATAQIDIPADVLGESQVVFAISLEPESGPRGPAPSGPVLSRSPQIDGVI